MKLNSKKFLKRVAQVTAVAAVTVGVVALAEKIDMPKDKIGELAYRAGVSIVLLGAWNISYNVAGHLIENTFEDNCVNKS